MAQSAHVFAELFSPLALGGTPRVDLENEFHFIEFTDQVSLAGLQSTTLTLPATVERAGGRRSSWADLITPGDLIRVSAQAHNGAVSASGTVLDGRVMDVSPSEALSLTGYQGGTTLTCENLAGTLAQDTVAWWMFYGAEEGWARARGSLPLESLSGTPAWMMAEYTSKVAFHYANWRVAGSGLGDRVGYHYQSLPAANPISFQLAMAEGAHLDLLRGLSEPAFHEFFVTTQADAPGGDGWLHKPTFKDRPFIRTPGTPEWDGGRVWLRLRPRPFPFLDSSGRVNMGPWLALPLFDTVPALLGPQVSLGRSARDVRNFWMVQPGYEVMSERMSFTAGVACKNLDSIERYGYAPSKVSTNLVINQGNEENMVEFARRLTRRLAAQQNRAEMFWRGTVTLPGLFPRVQPGWRIRFQGPHDVGVMEAYVTARNMTWTQETGGSTTFGVERALPERLYRGDGAWFAQGITAVEIKVGEDTPDTRRQE